MKSSSVALVIPTRNAGSELRPLLEAVVEQSRVPDEVLIVDSESEDETVSIAESFSFVRTRVIPKRSFDHGKTRDWAFGEVAGDIVVFMTQDAIPANEETIERLVAPFDDEEISMTYGRQLPRQSANRYEALLRQYNYPNESVVRTHRDIERLGIKAFFASDSCAAYRRSAYKELGGFVRPCLSNEDMFMAAKVLNSGKKLKYVADACVYHSHDLSFMQQFRRTAASTWAMKENHELIESSSAIREGLSMVREISGELIREREYGQLIKMFSDCMARLMGTKLYRVVGFGK